MKADAITGLSNGNSISTWVDSSENVRNATQSGSERPSYITGAPNGLPVVSFEGVNHFMSVADNNVWVFSEFSMFAVLEISAVSSSWWTRSWVAQDAGGGPNNKWMWSYYANGGTQLWHVNNPGVSNGAVFTGSAWAPAVSQYYVLDLMKSGSSYSFFNDGSANGTGTGSVPIPNAAAPLTVGMAEGGTFQGHIAELLIYNSALGESDRNDVGSYLGDKHGLSVSYTPEPSRAMLGSRGTCGHRPSPPQTRFDFGVWGVPPGKNRACNVRGFAFLCGINDSIRGIRHQTISHYAQQSQYLRRGLI